MQRLFAFGVVLLTLALAGCTSMRPLSGIDREAIRAQVKPGDEVFIVTRDGKSHEGTVHSLDERALVVKHQAGGRSEVPYETLSSLAVRRPDTVPSMFAALGNNALAACVVVGVVILLAFG